MPYQIPLIQRKLGLGINVFIFFVEEGKDRHPVYLSKQNSDIKVIDLLYWNEHYAWIK